MRHHFASCFLLLSCQAADGDSAGSGAPADCAAPAGQLAFDAYGGDTRVQLEATGFFRTEKLCQRWWLVTPDGHPFYSLGVNSITPYGDASIETGEQVYQQTVESSYESQDAWVDAVLERLGQWSLNTAGCWSDNLFLGRVPQTVSLYLAPYDWYSGEQGDLFDPQWELDVQTRVETSATPWSQEPFLLGWFLDNEVAWGPDWHDLGTLLEKYLEKDADAPGKTVAVELLLEQLGGLAGLNQTLGTSFSGTDEILSTLDGWDAWLDDDIPAVAEAIAVFRGQAAEHYFSITTQALRSADPNHLILGNREISVMAPLDVYQAASKYVDVFSINNYVFLDGVADVAMALTDALDPADGFAALHSEIDLPILITEFGFRADDAGLPNSYPPIYPTFDTQQERAEAFEEYASFHQSVSWIVGYHWFEWVDQPLEGRSGDGEDNNWGLVNELDQPYMEVTERMAEVNAGTWDHLLVD